jgi:hypothetical protein
MQKQNHISLRSLQLCEASPKGMAVKNLLSDLLDFARFALDFLETLFYNRHSQTNSIKEIIGVGSGRFRVLGCGAFRGERLFVFQPCAAAVTLIAAAHPTAAAVTRICRHANGILAIPSEPGQ